MWSDTLLAAERSHIIRIVIWAVTSAALGTTVVTIVVGRRMSAPIALWFAIQTLVWGSVHDGNTWALGGISGHAGLFAPIDDMARFIGAFLTPDRHPVLTGSSIAAMTRPRAGEPPDVRALGWRLGPTGWGSWSGHAFWHTGFTGTSLLVDPERGLGVALLTNALHPDRRLDARDALQADVHRLVSEAFS